MNQRSHVSPGWFARALPLFVILCSCACLSVTRASDYQGYVQSVAQIGNTAWIYVGGGHFGVHTCGGGQTTLIVYLDPTTAEGQSYLSLAISAKLSGSQVYVSGNDVCYMGNTPNGATSEAITVFWQE